MERFIQLNLSGDTDKSETVNRPEPDHKDPEPPASSKKLKRLGRKAAHKASTEFKRDRGIFSH